MLLFLFFAFFLLPQPSQADFEPWQGTWKGTCKYTNYNTAINQSDNEMSLKIKVITEGQVHWQIQYSNEPARNYSMQKAPTALKGHYILDEHNGILIDRFLVGNELRDLFSVNGKIFQSVTTLQNEKIKIITESFWSNPLNSTSLTENSSFNVLSFGLRDISRCLLEKTSP